MRILILGGNGFIGYHLTSHILRNTPWKVVGMDLGSSRLGEYLGHPRLKFVKGDITRHQPMVESLIRQSDVVMPLVAIAVPKVYVTDPLRVFRLDFEANLPIVKACVKYRKRLIFPSTSEVYGMCGDAKFDEEKSPLVLGPINKQRWIYSCSKQMLDRAIWAYGFQEGLDFTIFRPFNWIGPKLDSLSEAKEGCSRVVTQFIAEMCLGRPIRLVDGGRQKRTFTHISDGISALVKIVENKGKRCSGRIINVGNPANECSVRDLAFMLRKMFMAHPLHGTWKKQSKIIVVPSKKYYGEGYQDIMTRTPSIRLAKSLLHWKPKVALRDAMQMTLDAFLTENIQRR